MDKPLGWSSADLCRHVRKVTGGAKVGHAGTLDPLATGVVVLCLGTATKAIDRIMGGEKRYEATVDLSAVSPTDDLEAAPERIEVAAPPDEPAVRAACAGMVGKVLQRPPAHSAIKVDGERAYARARRGEVVAMEARRVVIRSIEVVRYRWPAVDLSIACGKGTYIRSIARDLGERLGTGGMLTALRRTAVGPYAVAEAVDPETVSGGVEAGMLAAAPG